MRSWCAIVVQTIVCILCLSVLAPAQNWIPDPQSIEGPWEIPTPKGIDGLFISATTSLQQTGAVTKINWQTVTIMVYHREQRRERRGGFSPGRDGATFDGTHLTIHFSGHSDLDPFDLDLTFDSAAQNWTGTWVRESGRQTVLLRRPTAAVGAQQNPLVGDWQADQVTTAKYDWGSLHVTQSRDGEFRAWLDRSLSGFDPRTRTTVTDQRNGELLRVASASGQSVVIETLNAIGPVYTYRGTLSDDGARLSGTWVDTPGGGRLNAPAQFVRRMNR
jgi:hypothetical protein